MRRVARPFRNLAWGLLTAALFPPMALGTFVATITFTACAMCVLAPMGLLMIALLVLAGVAWLALTVPSLLVRGDFRWSCGAARWICAPINWSSDSVNEGNWLDDLEGRFGDFGERVWAAYGRIAQRVEGCE